MAGRKAGTISAGIIGILLILLLTITTAGCGTKGATEEPEAGKSAQAGGEADSTPQDAQPQDYAFSVTVSEDTKTETFEVTTNSQELYYDLVGGEDATVTITVFSHPDGKMQAGANAFEPGPHQNTIYLTPGTYYMEILPSNCSVEVKVRD